MRRCSLLVPLLLAVACGSSPVADLDVQTFPDLGRAHLAESEPAPAYNSDPPTSGPHAPSWAPCGIYRQEIPDRFQVHDLEHGVVMIQYQPSLPPEEVQQLEELARELGEHTILAPRTGLSSPVVLTAWTKLLELEGVNEEAIRAFHESFAGRGPERVGCPFEVDEAAMQT